MPRSTPDSPKPDTIRDATAGRQRFERYVEALAQAGVVPESAEAQARLCFRAIIAILGEAGMTMADVVRINAYVSAAEYLGGYMKVRDEFVSNPPPASTLMIVQGFARPEFKIEIEAVAARAP